MKTVIIPTLNEEENIGRLIRAIYQNFNAAEMRVIVVDDDSTDRTHNIVRDLMRKYTGVSLVIRRNARGISGAVRLAAQKVRSGPVVVMDADFSHDPKFLEPMFQKLDESYDIVVGSRYIPGGKSVGWPGSRIAISRFATNIARFLLRLSIRDPMSGFVGCSDHAILVNSIEHSNMKFLLELVVKNRNANIIEIPIVFHDRTLGESKLGSLAILKYLFLVLRMVFDKGNSVNRGVS